MYQGVQNNVIGGGAILGEQVSRQPEVRAEMDRMEKAVEMLGMTAETLTSRLDGVRSQTGNQTTGPGGAPEPVLCGVAQGIRNQRQRVEAAQQLLQRALNELEI